MEKTRKEVQNKKNSDLDKILDKVMKDRNDSLKEVKDFAKHLVPNFDANENYKKMANGLLPKIKTGKKLNKAEDKLLSEIAFIQGLDSGLSMMEAVEERYRGMLFNLRKELVAEYDCKTSGEKMLVDLIVGAYSRNLTLTKFLVNTASTGHTTSNLNAFMSAADKGVDRANRHLISALETLRQMKQPALKVNVKTNNAFISQNQQFNQNENNKDK